MGASYSPFILSKIPVDAIGTEEQCLAILDTFARQGFCKQFCEIINGRAVEFHDGVGASQDEKLYRWLEGKEAKVIFDLQSLGGSRPYSHFHFLDGLRPTLFAPDDSVQAGSGSLQLSTGDKYQFTVGSAINVSKELENISKRIKEMDKEFWKEEINPLATYLEFHELLIKEIEQCAKAKVFYGFSY